MPWPQPAEYVEAIQNLQTSFKDPEIRTGTAALKSTGEPKLWTGNFATVFEVQAAKQRKLAVKCFTREVPGLQERYHHVSEHLKKSPLPFMVGFDYVPESVLVRGHWYSFLKMDWVEGLRLDELVAECFRGRWEYKSTLRQLCEMWIKVARRLRKAEVAHGDLQHGNVLLVPVPRSRTFSLKLIDYDGMCVPTLADRPSGELGHPAYQHPERLRDGGYGLEIDRFSHLLIYCSLRCLISGGQDLWERHYDGDNLLFGPRALERPDRSPVFQDVARLGDPAVQALVGRLILAAKGPLSEVPLLDEVVADSKVVPLTPAQESEVEKMLSRRVQQPPPVPEALPLPSPEPPEPTVPAPWWTTSPSPAPRAADVPRVPPNILSRIAVAASAATRTLAPVTLPKKLAVDLGNGVKMEMVLIPAGEFLMGTSGNSDDEKQHGVRITKPFYLGRYLVTQEQWLVVMGDNHSNFKGPRNPMEQVSWDRCQQFLDKLNAKAGDGKFSLPTEAQWEYGCRAGSTTNYYFGDDEARLGDYAWYYKNSGSQTHPVGEKKPNAWGLYDMHGNVFEWCQDWYDGNYYARSPMDDPAGPATGSNRVSRGGGWGNGAGYCRSANRYCSEPGDRLRTLGFRVARVPADK
jgi:formylglycine-generating enzyme required for sulfatase activity